MWFVIYMSHEERALPKIRGPQRGKISRRGSKPARTASFSKPNLGRAEFFALPFVGGMMRHAHSRPFAHSPFRRLAVLPLPVAPLAIICDFKRMPDSSGPE